MAARAVSAGSLMSLALALEQLAAQEQRRQIRGIERQRTLDRAFFTRARRAGSGRRGQD